jgi:importin subunit beta-1
VFSKNYDIIHQFEFRKGRRRAGGRFHGSINSLRFINEGFIKYMDAFKPFLYKALKNHQDYQVCSVAIGLIGDIARAFKMAIIPYCYEIMHMLMQNLSNRRIQKVFGARFGSSLSSDGLPSGAEGL